MCRPLLEFRAVRRHDANFSSNHVENDVLVAHPGCSQDSVSTSAVVLESIAPPVRSALSVHIRFGDPRRNDLAEHDGDARERCEICHFPAIA